MAEKNAVKRRRGRPEHVPTAALRRKVSIGAGGGMRHEAIALAIGVSVPTLRKHYEAELSTVAMQRRMEALQGVHKAAMRGSSSAAKLFLANEPEFTPPPADGDVRPEPAAAPAAAPAPAAKLGKKEAANAAATTAQVGTGWDGLLPGSAAVN